MTCPGQESNPGLHGGRRALQKRTIQTARDQWRMLATVIFSTGHKETTIRLSVRSTVLKHVLNNAQGKNNYSWGPSEGETKRYNHHSNTPHAKCVMDPSIDTNR
jgi:hypothetical protein